MSYTYPSYISQKLGVSVGTIISIFRGNKALFTRIYNDMMSGNTGDIVAVLNMVQGSQLLYNIVDIITSTPNSMAAPLALTYNGAVALGIIPPEVSAQLINAGANLNTVIIDFGYNAS